MKGSSKPYILYAGNNYPHKNLRRLESAFGKIKSEVDCKLFLITEFISDEELDELYKNASLFVFPSLCEGFGLPPLEAMKRGVAVAASNAASLPEILGEAALYFNPLDIDDMADKIKKALLDGDLRQELVQKGFAQAGKYSWQQTAQKTLEVYQRSLISRS